MNVSYILLLTLSHMMSNNKEKVMKQFFKSNEIFICWFAIFLLAGSSLLASGKPEKTHRYLLHTDANIARLKVSKAQQEEALLNFRSTLYNAGIEVQNAMGSYLSAQAKEELRQKQIDALLKSVSYTKELLTYGTASYLEVLSAQQSLLAAQISSVNDRLQQLDAVVSLYRALGGGWR